MMTDSDRLAIRLTNRYGIAIDCSDGVDPEGRWFDIRPSDVLPPHGFAVRVRRRLAATEASFAPDAFAAPLVDSMASASEDQKLVFARLAEASTESGGRITLVANGQELEPLAPESWPEIWRDLSFTVKRYYANDEDRDRDGDPILTWGSRLLGMVISLMPLEEKVDSGEPEGASHIVTTTQHERSPVNRAACIDLHGTCCRACGFSFAETYGTVGEGFIHVHHIIPVSQMGEGYVVDPASDLVPVCPNCHAMLHRSDPPMSVHCLRKIIVGTESRRGHQGADTGPSADATGGDAPG